MEKADAHGEHCPSSAPAAEDQVAPCAGTHIDIARLVVDHHASVYRYAYRLTNSAADADDLTQQAFLLAQQRLAQLREPARAAGWLMAIARNCFLKDRRRLAARMEPLVEEPIDASDDELPDWIDPEELQQALGRLSEDARLMLVLFFFEDCTYKEIAEALEVPLGTVMSRLSRAKAKLRHELLANGSAAAPPATELRKTRVAP